MDGPALAGRGERSPEPHFPEHCSVSDTLLWGDLHGTAALGRGWEQQQGLFSK